MSVGDCCGNPQPKWTSSKVKDRWSDLRVCASCQHIHSMESQLAPIAWTGAGCINCGGAYVGEVKAPKCERCGLTPQKDQDLHTTLASSHPDKTYIAAARAANGLGRWVLALKLATAATRWGSPEDQNDARRLRVESLYKLGQVDRALDEIYVWANSGTAPPAVWTQIATMEAETGNLEAATKALKYGVQVDPTNADAWADYTELLVVQGDLMRAMDAARTVLAFPSHEERGLAAIADAAEALYADGKPHDARLAANVSGDKIDKSLRLTWLMARLSAVDHDEAQSIGWLEKTLKLDPEHAEAKAALLALRPPTPPKKAGWLPW